MIKIEYDDNGKFSIKTEANIAQMITCFIAILEAIENDVTLEFAFKMAKEYRKERNAKNNSSN